MRSGCCARAASEQAPAAPTSRPINSRRLIRPLGQRARSTCREKQDRVLLLDVGKPLPSIPIRAIAGCCPRAVNGYATTVLLKSLMNSRRLMGIYFPGREPPS